MEEEQSSCLDFASSVAMMGSYYVLFSLRGFDSKYILIKAALPSIIYQSADAFTHKYGVWLRAASPPLPRERFNCSTRGQEFSRGTRTTEEGERDTVRGGETVVRDPVSETPQQVSFKGKEKVGRTVPVSSSTAAIVNHPDIVAAN
ncbi:hypothetical protein ACOSQ2_029522 [Xanthoceras sorbifolium]